MPVDWSRYPPDWGAISKRIRFERAKGCCEWCGVPNGAWIYRDEGETVVLAAECREEAVLEAPPSARVTRIVLTVAHLGVAHADGTPGDKHDKMDVRDENLAALCQACHLRYDIREHMHNAAVTRRRKRIAAGQLEIEL